MNSFKVHVKDMYDLKYFLHELHGLIEKQHSDDIISRYTDVLMIAFHTLDPKDDQRVDQAKKLIKKKIYARH